MIITKTSELTGIEHTLELDITEEQFDMVQNRRELGLKIQDIVPHLPADQREFLISGSPKEEWNRLFGSPDFN